MRVVLAIILLMLLFGCVSESNIAQKKESVQSQDKTDFNGDGSFDYAVYAFTPVSMKEFSGKSQRFVYVSSDKTIEPGTVKKLTDADVLKIDSAFEDFKKNSEELYNSCLAKLGLRNTVCPDSRTCYKVCSASSVGCKNIADNYDSALGSFIFAYQKDSTALQDIETNIHNRIPKLVDLTDDEKRDLIVRLNSIKDSIASLNGNPLLNQNELALCEKADYQVQNLENVSAMVGTYSSKPSLYHYTVIIALDSASLVKDDKLRYSELIVRDDISKSLGLGKTDLAVPTEATASFNDSRVAVEWQPIKGKQKTLLFYSFVSTLDPDQVTGMFNSPRTQLRTPNIDAFAPTLSLYQILFSITWNFYASFSFAIAITIITILFLLTFIPLVFNLVRSAVAKEGRSIALKRTFGRVRVTWKSDLASGAFSLLVGIGMMNFLAPKITTALDIFAVINLATTDPFASVAISSLIIGPVLIYLSLDNRLKVAALEKAYGKAIKEEKDTFGAHVVQLKEKVKELRELLDSMTRESFDVGREYDVLGTVPIERVDALAQKADSYSKKVIEDELTKVEDTIEKLSERKHLALENWSKWASTIEKILRENEEVQVSGLIAVPSSLRIWAMKKYADEHAGEGLSLDGETLKRKIVSAEKIASSLVAGRVLYGCVLIKDSKVALSSFSEGNATLIGVLTFKFLNYVKYLPKHLAQHDFSSIVTVGDRYVTVVVKQKTLQALLVIEKDKFKPAVDEWKAKMKGF